MTRTSTRVVVSSFLLAVSVALVATTALSPASTHAASAADSGRPIAIIHARAYTIAADEPIDDATIVLRDGRIAAIGARLEPPADAIVVDAQGRPVTPGLMNAATQIGLYEVSGDADTTDQSTDAGPFGAALDVRYAIDANALTVQKARADGVSRAVVYPDSSGQPPFSGLGALLHLVTGPDITETAPVAMFARVGASSAARNGGSRAAQWVLLLDALRSAAEATGAPSGKAKSKRRDTLPDRSADPREPGRLDVEALRPVLDGTIPLVIAAHRESDLRHAAALSAEFGVRVIVLGGAEAWRAADVLAWADVGVVLDPYADLPMSYDEIGARRDNAARLVKAGIPIAFSVPGAGIYLSYSAGPALREGAGIGVANGLPYAEALRAMTVNPARLFGVADRYGTLEPGRDADLVVWDGDPLEPSSAPLHVFVGGREIGLRTRQTELRDRYRPVLPSPATPTGAR